MPRDIVADVIGKNGENLQEIAKQSGLVQATVTPDRNLATPNVSS